MEKLLKIDPMLYGFMKDEALELAERIGLALIEGARYGDISYDRNYLPSKIKS